MGTSVSHRSPITANWRAVEAIYSKGEVPIERTVREIWRAATNQPVGDLAESLKQPIIADCLRIAQQSQSIEEALHDTKREIAFSRQASLATEIAQRAVSLAFQVGADRVDVFVNSIFAEAGNYLVSRDLPGFVGAGIARNISEVISLKDSIKKEIIQKVSQVPKPLGSLTEPIIWRDYVSEIVDHLAGRV